MNEGLHLIEPTSIILNERSEEVPIDEIGSEKMQGLIARMIELSVGKGHNEEDSRQMVGLAAVQLGVALRVIVIDITADGSNKEQTLVPIINPVIKKRSDEMVDGREGCWSCANICGNVSRHESVTLSGLNKNGEPISMDSVGFVARIAQHEVDHLDGIRFPDRIPEDQPERLHTVRPEEFERYRTEWANWGTLCDRRVWLGLKESISSS